MIDLNKYKIIELSYELVPGELKIDGSYTDPVPLDVGLGRNLQTQEIECSSARMHFIQGHTHIGTHAEAPNKYVPGGLDVAGLPIDTFMGEAVLCDLSYKKTREAIHPKDLEKFGIKQGDIVLMRSDPETWGHDDRIHLTFPSIAWLIKKRIKAIAMQKIWFAPYGTPYGRDHGDGRILRAGIGLVDCIIGLDQITKPRVFFIALPVKMHHVTAAWIRAIALEEK